MQSVYLLTKLHTEGVVGDFADLKGPGEWEGLIHIAWDFNVTFIYISIMLNLRIRTYVDHFIKSVQMEPYQS
jgi:hypothetical protein